MFNINLFPNRAAPSASISVQGKNIKLLIGLGNPGEKHKNTYHNVGSMFVDHFSDRATKDGSNETQTWKKVKSFTYTKLNNLILAKPGVFMNESGKSVKDLVRYFRAKPEEILIVHDDSDISLGEYKISYGRGSAGHNGVESIIKALGTDKFSRLRIGVRYKNQKAGEFVLKRTGKQQLKSLEKLFSKIETTHLKVETE